jgi:hypothetical protein
MSRDDNSVKIDGKLDTYRGDFTINVMEILENLDDEQKKELISDGGWWSLISKEMAKDIVNQFSRDCYAEEYTRLRYMILNSEAMPKLIKEWAISVFESRESAQEKSRYWDSAYWSLYHKVRDYFGERGYDIFNKLVPKLPDHYYNKPYSKELMEEVGERVKEWATLFPEKKEEDL